MDLSEEAITHLKMKLYQIQFDGSQYFVEAPNFAMAIVAWKRYVAASWEIDYAATDEPESVLLIHDEPVIRLAETAASALFDKPREGE
jgi:hypothetical protein